MLVVGVYRGGARLSNGANNATAEAIRVQSSTYTYIQMFSVHCWAYIILMKKQMSFSVNIVHTEIFVLTQKENTVEGYVCCARSLLRVTQ